MKQNKDAKHSNNVLDVQLSRKSKNEHIFFFFLIIFGFHYGVWS